MEQLVHKGRTTRPIFESRVTLIPVRNAGEIAALATQEIYIVDMVIRPPDFSWWVLYENTEITRQALRSYRNGTLKLSAKELHQALVEWDEFIVDEVSHIEYSIKRAIKDQTYKY